MKNRLYTIGYEQRHVDETLDRLIEVGVKVLLDVRELPQSRKRGFSKTALAAASAGRGIEYHHVRALGSPRELRHTLRRTGDFEAFARGYLLHLRSQLDSVREMQQLVYRQTCCLLCFEKDARECHRQFIASAIKALGQNGLEIVHL